MLLYLDPFYGPCICRTFHSSSVLAIFSTVFIYLKVFLGGNVFIMQGICNTNRKIYTLDYN